ncbi:enoyl-CoA hydratase/isomerase family protein [Variovorax sp. J22R133]|uniref:enoyl-CoA hydratase/isomerase family protein n=1 Tax=Variovorax brevis TaxID=3053503 RepID=UPI002574FD2D|nr:enoyl-CoA hydratase/isomerase family protein [Variovorax sp. J22R133]MDM0114029.1 enoyl-CoA hydratase/isomerase family protein [Variovorax sp. J22R133]
MPSETIPLRESQLAIEDGVALFTHQRPAARNALSLDLRADYRDMLGQVESDRRVRALIITGSGGSFCAGGDVKGMSSRSDPEFRTPDAMRRRLQVGHGLIERLRSLEMPVIAAVDGPAVGAGFSFALAADFILASHRAYFCMSFLKVGLIPDLGAFHFLPRAVGLPMAKELAMTARRVNAAEGKQLGFVHTLHEPESLQADAMHFARRFLAGPREAIGLTKALLNKSYETPYATLAELEGNAQAVVSTLPYHHEAVEAFTRGEALRYDWDRTTG